MEPFTNLDNVGETAARIVALRAKNGTSKAAGSSFMSNSELSGTKADLTGNNFSLYGLELDREKHSSKQKAVNKNKKS